MEIMYQRHHLHIMEYLRDSIFVFFTAHIQQMLVQAQKAFDYTAKVATPHWLKCAIMLKLTLVGSCNVILFALLTKLFIIHFVLQLADCLPKR